MLQQRGSVTARKPAAAAAESKASKAAIKPLSRASAIDELKDTAKKILASKGKSADVIKTIDEDSLPELIGKTAEIVMPLVNTASSLDKAANKFKLAFKNAVTLLTTIDKNEANSEAKQKALQQTIDQISGELKAAKNTIFDIEATQQTIQAQLSQSQSAVKKLDEQLATATAKLAADEKEQQKLKQELKESQQTKEDHALTLSRSNRQLDELRQQLTAAQRDQKDLTSRLLQTSDEKSALAAKIEHLTAKLAASSETLAAKTELWETRFLTQEEKLQALTEQLNAARQELSRQSVPSTPVSIRYGLGGIPSIPTQSRLFDRRPSVPATPTYSGFALQQSPAHNTLERRSSVPATATEKKTASQQIQNSSIKTAAALSTTPGATNSKADAARTNFETYFTTQFNTLMNEIQKIISQNAKNVDLVNLATEFRFEFIKLYTDMKQTTLTTTDAIIKKLVSGNVLYSALLTSDIDCKTEDRVKKLSTAVGGQKTIYTVVFQAYYYGIIDGTSAHLEYFSKQRSACDQAAPQTADHGTIQPEATARFA